MLTRDDILGILDLKSESVAVPEWGGDVSVRELTGSERDAYEQSLFRQREDDPDKLAANVRAKLCALSVIGADGKRLFVEADVESLGNKSAAALDRIYDVAHRLSRMGGEDVDELEKN